MEYTVHDWEKLEPTKKLKIKTCSNTRSLVRQKLESRDLSFERDKQNVCILLERRSHIGYIKGTWVIYKGLGSIH